MTFVENMGSSSINESDLDCTTQEMRHTLAFGSNGHMKYDAVNWVPYA